MKTTYVWRNGRFENKATGEPMETIDRVCVPHILSDIKPYKSMASGKLIDGRAAQREDLKRSGCRLADPSEWKPEGCRTKKWADRLGMDHNPDPPPTRQPTTIGPVEVK
jgi:hypothetical protein